MPSAGPRQPSGISLISRISLVTPSASFEYRNRTLPTKRSRPSCARTRRIRLATTGPHPSELGVPRDGPPRLGGESVKAHEYLQAGFTGLCDQPAVESKRGGDRVFERGTSTSLRFPHDGPWIPATP